MKRFLIKTFDLLLVILMVILAIPFVISVLIIIAICFFVLLLALPAVLVFILKVAFDEKFNPIEINIPDLDKIFDEE